MPARTETDFNKQNGTQKMHNVTRTISLRLSVFIGLMAVFVGGCADVPADSPSNEASPADLVVMNAEVLTVDSEFSVAEAVAVHDSVFVAVGSNDDVEEYIGERTRVIDAEGKTVIPGLIESHSHATSVVRREYATPHPYEQLESIGDIQRWLREQAEQTPEGDWILIPRTDVTHIQEGRIPTLVELDEAAPNHPVVFNWQYANYQIQVLNSAALEAAGITSETPVPEGGHIELGEDGEPTGVLENSGELTAEFLEPREIPDDRYLDDLERLFRNYNEVGITSIFERNSDPDGYHTYEQLKEEERLPVRVSVTIGIDPDGTVEGTEQVIEELSVEPGEGDDRVRVGPLKVGVDGGILYGTAYMREPYREEALDYYRIDDPDHRGTLQPPFSEENLSEALYNVIHTGHSLGWQMSAHVTGDAGVDAVLDAIEASNAELPEEDRRFNLIHSYFAHPETADRVKELGVGVDTQPAWHYNSSDALAEVLAPERMQIFIGLQEWQRAGVPVAINSDHMYGFDPNSSLNPYNPFLTMSTAITRRTIGGQVMAPDQRVSREDALRMMTIDAAWLSFEESQKGSIEVGKLGDLAILSDDFLTCDEEEIKDIHALVTVVGGEVVYERDTADSAD